MRRALLSLAFLAFPFLIYAQSHEIERLRKILKEHPQQDTFRVNRLNEICNLTPRISNEEMESFAAEALSLAGKLNYTRGVGYALLVNGRLVNLKGNKIEAAKLIQQADSVARQTGDQIMKWWVLFRSNTLTSDYKLQLSTFLKTEGLALQLNKKELIVRSQNWISNSYFSLADYARAMEYGMKALKNAEALNDPGLLYNVYGALASVYSAIGEYEKANFYSQKQPDLIRQLGYGDEELANLYNGLGENARLAKKYHEAINYYNQSLEASHEKQIQTVVISNLADVYTSMDSLPLAFKYAEEAVARNKELKRADLDPWIEGILARAYLKNEMIDSALYYANSGYNKATQLGVMEDILSTSKTLADGYARKNDFKNAYTYFNRYISNRDSVMGAEVKNKTTVLEHNFEMEKKEDQIVLLNQQQKLQKNFLISALIVLGLILISAILLLRNIRQQRKANTLLQKQKQEIDDKAQELSVQKDNLEKSYDNVEMLAEIGRKITSSLSVDRIIGTVYDNVNALMDAATFGIGIYHDDTKSIDFPATYENGQALPAYSNSIYDQNRLAALCFVNGKEIVINDLTSEYASYLQNLPTPIAGNQPASLIYLPLKVKEKMFGVITVQSFRKNAFSDYNLYMLRTIAVYSAIALENAESFKKLNVTISSLKETQKQLIQSEKMASLGELTAGIAHEIQNPLNFVNNFSELNSELISELKDEITNGNVTEAKALADSIDENEKKIIFHGRRADGIVKGMLQHSRSSNSVKEPTNINTLADEYLRLAYHGLRAKDKSFNASMKTEFDESIGMINVVPQDLGRVILNLITNAFYAVTERKMQSEDIFEPTVSVTTKKIDGQVLISVKDNGNGIPQKVLDKIFQPFFTTKPAGQGTGLGLSLSYDIIKAHGAELKVETREGDGAEFRIEIPVS